MQTTPIEYDEASAEGSRWGKGSEQPSGNTLQWISVKSECMPSAMETRWRESLMHMPSPWGLTYFSGVGASIQTLGMVWD